MHIQRHFEGKVIIITGSSSGIGQSAAIEFAKEGGSVVIHGRDAQRLNQTEKMIMDLGLAATNVVQVIGDIEDVQTAEKIIDEAIKAFGRIDVLINNAACTSKSGITDPYDLQNLDHIYNVNLRSVVQLTMLALPHLEKTHGTVLNVGSCASHRLASAGVRPFYGVMKAALDHWTRTLAQAWGEKGVRVNSINPGPTADTMIVEQNGQRGPVEAKFGSASVLKRLGHPTEMAKVMKFLCSEDASYITGVCLLVDGGLSVSP